MDSAIALSRLRWKTTKYLAVYHWERTERRTDKQAMIIINNNNNNNNKVVKLVAKVLWTWTCVMQVQRKFRCDSVHVAPLETAGIFKVEMIPYCGPMSHGTRGRLACERWGPRSGGSALLVVGFCVLVSILLRSLSMSGAALSIRVMRALRLRGY